MTDKEIFEHIEEIFQENYEVMQITAGSFLSDSIKRTALLQIIYYYKRLKKIADKVTHTEVKLTLPDQKTKDGRAFTIEGVVDIIKEDEDTWMYDIKTHDAEYIKGNKDFYEKQLNIYAYIWQKLRKEYLGHTAVISTALPINLRQAIQFQDENRIDVELEKWEPVIDMPYAEDRVDSTIEDFAKVVDCIENKEFVPPSSEKLKMKFEGTNTTFGTFVCRNCDSRFSCSAFRNFIQESGQKLKGSFEKFFEDIAPDFDQEDWVNTHLGNESFWEGTFQQLFEED